MRAGMGIEMTDLMKLPDDWREASKRLDLCIDLCLPDACVIYPQCADELEAALPVWTKITDSLDTLPGACDTDVLVAEYIQGEWHLYMWTGNDLLDTGAGPFPICWRPLTGIDYPPEDMK